MRRSEPGCEAVRKALRDKRAVETLTEIVQVRCSHNDDQIKADNRLDIRIDGLAPDDAVAKALPV